jgi:hypothetical protein
MGVVQSKQRCSETRIGAIATIQCVIENPWIQLCSGTTGAGREARLRMIFGMTSAGWCCERESATNTGTSIGYRSGAGSKLSGIENNEREEERMRHRRLLESRSMNG